MDDNIADFCGIVNWLSTRFDSQHICLRLVAHLVFHYCLKTLIRMVSSLYVIGHDFALLMVSPEENSPIADAVFSETTEISGEVPHRGPDHFWMHSEGFKFFYNTPL